MEANVIKNPELGVLKSKTLELGEGGQEIYGILKKLYAYITLLKIEIEFTKENISTETTGYSKMIVMKAANI